MFISTSGLFVCACLANVRASFKASECVSMTNLWGPASIMYLVAIAFTERYTFGRPCFFVVLLMMCTVFFFFLCSSVRAVHHFFLCVMRYINIYEMICSYPFVLSSFFCSSMPKNHGIEITNHWSRPPMWRYVQRKFDLLRENGNVLDHFEVFSMNVQKHGLAVWVTGCDLY